MREARQIAPSAGNKIDSGLTEVKSLVARLGVTSTDTTSTSDLKELIPREMAKVKRALQQIDTEIVAIE
jgi:hypothetical protein